MHVGLIYWDPFTAGGVQSQVAGRLNHLGYPGGPVRYTLFCKKEPPQPHPWPHVRTVRFSGWDRLSVAVSEYTAARSLVKALDRLHREDPLDLLDLHAGGAGGCVAAWSKWTGVPYVFVAHSLRFFTLKGEGMRWEVPRYYGWSNRRATDGAKRVIAVSGALKKELVRFGVPAEKIEVQHTAINPAGGPRVPLCDRGGPLRILFVGRTSHEKGLDLLIEAVAVCGKAGAVNLTLTVVGDISCDHPACKRTRELSLPVEFVGTRSNAEARRLMQEHDLLAIPSRYDSCPVVAIEGLQAGVLILGSRVGGIPEMIEDGKTGLLVPPEDVTALADAITRVAADRGRYDGIREAARRAGQRYLWSERAPEVLATYQSCVLAREKQYAF